MFWGRGGGYGHARFEHACLCCGSSSCTKLLLPLLQRWQRHLPAGSKKTVCSSLLSGIVSFQQAVESRCFCTAPLCFLWQRPVCTAASQEHHHSSPPHSPPLHVLSPSVPSLDTLSLQTSRYQINPPLQIFITHDFDIPFKILAAQESRRRREALQAKLQIHSGKIPVLVCLESSASMQDILLDHMPVHFHCNAPPTDGARLLVRGRRRRHQPPTGQSHRARQTSVCAQGCAFAMNFAHLRHCFLRGDFQSIIERAVAKGLGLGKGGEEVHLLTLHVLQPLFHSFTALWRRPSLSPAPTQLTISNT